MDSQVFFVWSLLFGLLGASLAVLFGFADGLDETAPWIASLFVIALILAAFGFATESTTANR